MRTSARVVVVGGGVGGASVAYWLTRLGWTDVLLCERADLTSGSTFHSAGLVGQLRGSLSLTRMMMNSVELYRTLADEVGLETGWHEVGSLRLASSPERMQELTRQAGWAKTFGLPLELVSAEEAERLFPPMSTEGVLGAAYLPTDGYIDPSQLTFALAEGARRRGAEIAANTRVTGIDVERGRVSAVETTKGRVETEIVVNAGGMFAAEIGRMAGVNVPVVPFAHEYLVTRPTGLPLDMPTMRDPSLLVYFRGESGGLVVGGYERHSAPWGLDGIPPDFNGRLLPEDWDRFEELLTNAVVRVPELEHADAVQLVNGPEAFTPDGEFILGESDVRGFWIAAGFCAHGLAGAGGMGQLVAEWIVEGLPSLDVWEMDSRRFGRHYVSREYTLARTREVYETYYDVKYPGHEREAGRPLRLSPTYERLRELGASFGEKSGWERANWFESNAPSGDDSLRPRGWAGRLWSPAIGAEHRACRERAALFDETSFAKIDVVGRDAATFLEGLCDNRVAREVGAVSYTQMLNAQGGIECDFTVARLAEDRFRIVTGTAFGQHDSAWIRSHAPEDGSVYVEDVTSRFACLGLWGPLSRAILQPLTSFDLGNGSFPYMRARELAVGPVPCLAMRVTYVGELGWELYCPIEFGLRLWDTIWEAGREHGLAAAGYKAIDSLRVEKGYRVWGADITPSETPWEAGLGFAVKLDKGAFEGRDALLTARGRDAERRLACLVLADPRAVVLGSEPVRIDGETAGRVTSGGYGYSVERSIAYAYVPAEHAEAGQPVEVEIFGESVPGEIAAEPLWDPQGERIRA
ncbi:MAG: FAD-dependent oxidoreductase [Thermoleophilia bacterium]|nr:FAD-dependent oxidoreductase [Thermoleophilia bacterium]